MTAAEIIEDLRELRDPSRGKVFERFSIATPLWFGISTPEVKSFAKKVKKIVDDRHAVAAELWQSGIFEARSVAFLIDDPKQVTPEQMDAWVQDFDNWATVDGACGYLFCRTPYAYDKAFEWALREPEFEKRAAFSLIAYLAVHDKKAANEKLAAFLPLIEKNADDERNFVKKAVNWALRQIGKRNIELNRLAIESAHRIKASGTKAGRWTATDAIRELRSEVVRERLIGKNV